MIHYPWYICNRSPFTWTLHGSGPPLVWYFMLCHGGSCCRRLPMGHPDEWGQPTSRWLDPVRLLELADRRWRAGWRTETCSVGKDRPCWFGPAVDELLAVRTSGVATCSKDALLVRVDRGFDVDHVELWLQHSAVLYWVCDHSLLSYFCCEGN